jgi:hypothetical protein
MHVLLHHLPLALLALLPLRHLLFLLTARSAALGVRRVQCQRGYREQKNEEQE